MIPWLPGSMVPTIGALAEGANRMLSASEASTFTTRKQPHPLVAAALSAAAKANANTQSATRHVVIGRDYIPTAR